MRVCRCSDAEPAPAARTDGDDEAAPALHHRLHVVLREDHVHGLDFGIGGARGRQTSGPLPSEGAQLLGALPKLPRGERAGHVHYAVQYQDCRLLAEVPPNRLVSELPGNSVRNEPPGNPPSDCEV